MTGIFALPVTAVPLRLLGSARWVDQTAIPPSPMLWLFAYLAAAETWVERAEIATLLWADVPESDARNNLRQLLHRSKNLKWAKAIEGNTKALRLSVPSDVSQFRTAIRQADWQKALAVYGGALLEGLLTPTAFGAWLETERAALHEDWRTALIGRIQELDSSPDASLPNLLVQLLELDPYNEEALHGLLKHATVLGSNQVALRQFELFQARLRTDLGVEPQPETLALVATLKGQVQPDTNLRFVGRQAEQAEIGAQFMAGTRLMMLRGLGGIGKTTLAKEILEQQKNLFDRAIWLTLRDIRNPDDVPLAVAAVLGFNLRADSSPWLQIGQHFQESRVLLVLDNVEHLGGLAEPLNAWLEAAPQLTLLLTSRVALNIPNEWVLTLGGLAYPDNPDLEAARAASAVQLFVARAARRRGGFTLNSNTLAGILRICQLVQGLPLGLELAAAWLGELSLEALIEGLEANAEWLEVNEPEIPEAHRSLRTVFEHSWELLEDDLRQTLSAISVFQGGFDRPAALEGMGVSARSLLGLLARSLLHQHGGRYELHPLVQTYALKKLEQPALKKLQRTHAQYFAHFAEQAEIALRGGPQQITWLNKVTSQHQNIMAVFEYNTDPALVLRTLAALPRYFHLRSRTLEAWNALQTAIAQYQPPSDALLLARAELALGIQGDFLALYSRACQHLENAIKIFSILDQPVLHAKALGWWGANAIMRGQLQAAEIRIRQALQIQRQENDVHGMVNTLNDLGRIACDRNDKIIAKQYFEQSLECANICGHRNGQAIALQNIADILPPSPEKYQLIEQSLSLTRALGNQTNIGASLYGLGEAAIAEGNDALAQQHLLEALPLLRDGRYRDAIYAMLVLTQPLVRQGYQAQALTLFGATTVALERLDSPLAEHQYQHFLQLENQARTALGQAKAEAAYQQGQAMSVDQAIAFAQGLPKLEPMLTKKTR